MIKKVFLYLLIIFSGLSAFSQKSMEIEDRVSAADVDGDALDFFSSEIVNKKIRWYYEKNFSGNSFEAKFKYNKRRYSVEFDTSGNIRDIEIKVKERRIPDNVIKNINSYFEEKYTHSKIVKVQLQYKPDVKNFKDFNDVKSDLSPSYEIVAKTKKDKIYSLRELLFDMNGELITDFEKVIRNTDNLEY